MRSQNVWATNTSTTRAMMRPRPRIAVRATPGTMRTTHREPNHLITRGAHTTLTQVTTWRCPRQVLDLSPAHDPDARLGAHARARARLHGAAFPWLRMDPCDLRHGRIRLSRPGLHPR